MSNLQVKFLVTIYLLSTTLTMRNITPNLNSICPTMAELKQKQNKDQHTILSELKILSFLKYITNKKAKARQMSPSEEIFNYSSPKNTQMKGSIQESARIEMINDDSSTTSGIYLQNQLFKEALVNGMLNSEDPNYFYFPKMNYCVELTEQFNFFHAKQNEPDINKNFIEVGEGQAAFVISTQKLDFTLNGFGQAVKEMTEQNLEVPERIAMAINLTEGLIKMNERFIHCDIKGDTIQMKKIVSENARFQVKSGLELIEAKDQEFYHVLLTDFNNVAFKRNKVKNRCTGGTPGFIPNEFFNKQAHTDNYDVYSLGMTLIDYELSSINMNGLSELLQESQKQRTLGKMLLDHEQRQRIEKNPLFKVLLEIMNDPSH